MASAASFIGLSVAQGHWVDLLQQHFQAEGNKRLHREGTLGEFRHLIGAHCKTVQRS
jgi:hypothetical protein